MALLADFVAETPPLRLDEGGAVRVGQTRVTLDTVIGAWLDGATAEEIVHGYDTLQLADVHSVISYYLRHRQEVEDYLARRREEAEDVCRENERRFPPTQPSGSACWPANAVVKNSDACLSGR